jgi:hypothetical protein
MLVATPFSEQLALLQVAALRIVESLQERKVINRWLVLRQTNFFA